MSRLIMVSNRVSLPSQQAQAGGLAVALADTLSRYSGLWCGWSGRMVESPRGTHVEQQDNIQYLTLDYSPQEHEDFYVGFCNSLLWPLFHYRTGLAQYSREKFASYMAVNARFAEAIAAEARPEDSLWIHDYHFLMVARFLRERGMTQRIGFFLHIPFPALEVLRVTPDYRELVEAMCAYDLLGFQTQGDARNFLQAVQELCCARIIAMDDASTVVHVHGRQLTIGHFPIGIDTPEMERLAEAAADQGEVEEMRQGLNGRDMIIGVDRLDYSKGLLLRMEAYQDFLMRYAGLAARTCYVQIAPPSRTDVDEYRLLREELEMKAAHINGLHATVDHTPIRYLCRNFSREALAGMYRAARVGLVTPLRDGMNLVAKEYVACQDAADPGVLVLSEFAGAAAQLDAALIINPNDRHMVADALYQALSMPLAERQERYQAMMAVLRGQTVHDWAEAFLTALWAETPAERFQPYAVVSGG